jgi:hypothetical protein
MKTVFTTVFTADKRTYGTEFYEICYSLEELKKEIIDHCYYMFKDENIERVYSEEMFQKACLEGEYTPFEIDLHPDEEIAFHGYDGTSWFTIEQKNKKILSRTKMVYKIEEE